MHDVSFTIAQGDVLGVVGESGAGKSLTGAAIIGLIDPPGRIASGEVRLAGRRIDNLPYDAMRSVRGREIGAVFQDPLTSLNPLYTSGRQLIETIRTHLPMSEVLARERAVGLLEEVGIPAAARRIDHYPHQFSGGMRQRVVIALALCANPRLVVADEPTTALDVSVQAQVLNLMRELQRDLGLTYLFISHNLAVVHHIADRVAGLHLSSALPARERALPTRDSQAARGRRGPTRRSRLLCGRRGSPAASPAPTCRRLIADARGRSRAMGRGFPL